MWRDGVYYESVTSGVTRIAKISRDGGSAIVLRSDPGATIPTIAADGSALYYGVPLRSNILGSDRADREIRCARPESGAGVALAHIAGNRLPGVPTVLSIVVSPDGQSLAMPLVDGAATNLWVLPTSGSEEARRLARPAHRR